MSCSDDLKLTKSLFRKLPYYDVTFLSYHGQFNNLLLDNLPTKRNLEKLTSINDLALFSLNTIIVISTLTLILLHQNYEVAIILLIHVALIN